MFLLLACAPSNISLGTEDSAGVRPGDSGLEEVPGSDTAVDDTAEPVDDPEADAAYQDALYSSEVVHEIAITLDRDAELALRDDPYAYTPGEVAIDGEDGGTVGVRLRGKIGSFRELSGKPKFKIDFAQYDTGRRFHGLHALALNNSVVDCGYLRDPLGYRIFRDAGVGTARTGFASVTVNGEAYGLYVLVEVPDEQYLEIAFPDDDEGQLYDGKYEYNPNTGRYTLLDFGIGVDDHFQLEEGTENGNAEIVAVSDAVSAMRRGNNPETEIATLIDWEQVHRQWAVEELIGHLDGYMLNTNNYRVYFRPSDGKMVILPTDFDYAFQDARNWGMSWSTPRGTLASACWNSTECAANHAAAMSTVIDGLDYDEILAWYDEIDALTLEIAKDDPRRECGSSQVGSNRASLRSWTVTAVDTARDHWGI